MAIYSAPPKEIEPNAAITAAIDHAMNGGRKFAWQYVAVARCLENGGTFFEHDGFRDSAAGARAAYREQPGYELARIAHVAVIEMEPEEEAASAERSL